MNTRINYLYRDACNYKVHNEVVIKGTFTSEQIDEIIRCLSDGENFIPSQVGLPEQRFDEVTEDDTCWFELNRKDFEETKDEETSDLTIDEIVGAFLAAKGNWNEYM